VPDYNTCRCAFGLPAVNNFSDITPDEQIAATLKELYGNVNNIGERAARGTSQNQTLCCASTE
jgi:hypothetical protein